MLVKLDPGALVLLPGQDEARLREDLREALRRLEVRPPELPSWVQQYWEPRTLYTNPDPVTIPVVA